MQYLLGFLLLAVVLYAAFFACIVIALVVNVIRERRNPQPPTSPPASMYLPSVEPVRTIPPVVRSQAVRQSEPKKCTEQWLRSQAVRANDHIGERNVVELARRRKGA
jgi:hypothetical protein